MIVLGIESATDLVGAALHREGETVAEVCETGGRRHAEVLAPAIAEVLGRAGVALGELDAIAVDVGPGLFTGLRVGVATAKGIAQALGTGLVGCTSLETLAAAALDGGWAGPVLAVVDARRGEVFAARYGRGPTGVPVALSTPVRCRPEGIAALVDGATGTLALGDGAVRYRELLADQAGVTLADGTHAHPSPATLASLGARRLAAGAPPLAAIDLQAQYMRGADARINWVRRESVGPADA